MTESSHNWSAYWKTRNSTSSLEGAGVEHHDALRQYWDDLFASADKGTRVMDLACGAGTVARRAHHAGLAAITALDYAPEALRLLKADLPSIDVVEGSLTAPVPGAPFDLVVSQFGVEYAGTDGFESAAKMVADGGTLALLCHLKDGGIDREVAGDVAFATAIQESRFTDAARAFVEKEHRAQNIDRSTQHFKTMEDAARSLASLAAARPGSIAEHLLRGAQQLIDRRHNYDLKDITGWLDGMDGEIAAYRARMTAMNEAALSEADVANTARLLETAGLTNITAVPFPQDDTDTEHFAWSIRASKPR
ncbi:MAG: class I SAM-dependent methyltransferase [Pseudomonadota bacterium]